MEKQVKTIVFSDCDGTLLNSQHELSARTRQAFCQLQAQQIPFVIISGRSPLGLYPLLKRYQLACPLICFSGALTLGVQGEILAAYSLAAKGAEQVLAWLQAEQAACVWNAFTEKRWLVKSLDAWQVRREAEIVPAQPEAIQTSLLASLQANEQIYKLMLMCDSAEIVELERKLQLAFPEFSIVRSSNILLEIMAKGVNKAQAASEFARTYGLDLQDCVAFGDSYNDLELLQTVGQAFLMANANPDLQAIIPSHTASNDEDGIYHGLKQLNLL